MHILDCNIGRWQAKATVQDVDNGKLLAIISTTDRDGDQACASRHTVVFDHQEGRDRLEETRALVQRLLSERYGV